MEYTEEQKAALLKLRAPFEPNQINLLPKPHNKDSAKGNCKECGGYHGLPAAHLEYIGHAALTARLLDVDPFWSWEPVGADSQGLPALDKDGGLWIRLTVAGMTRLGYGDAQGKTGGNATKERIGDALRNAGMRFGAALDLWHKGVLEMEPERFEPNSADKWVMKADSAVDITTLEKVWAEGAADLVEKDDRKAYAEFKESVKIRKNELLEAADRARTAGQP